MKYTDKFLSALGAWQNGWREDEARRLLVTEELEQAIATLSQLLPITDPLPTCYRKRFLVPRNPTNGGDFVPLIFTGRIEEGPASWSSNPEFHHSFKEIARNGQVTALFRHLPKPCEVVVDIPALWRDPTFQIDVAAYSKRGGENAAALLKLKNRQGELILRAPLLAAEVVGLVGRIGDYDQLSDQLGAVTEEEQEEAFSLMIKSKIYADEARWVSAEQAQNAIRRTRAKWLRKSRRHRTKITLAKTQVSLIALARALSTRVNPKPK